MSRKKWPLWAGLLVIGTGVLLTLPMAFGKPPQATLESTATDSPSVTPEPVIPTPTARPTGRTQTPDIDPTAMPTATTAPPTEAAATARPTLSPTPAPLNDDVLWQGQPRWGIGGASHAIASYDVAPLKLGWYLDWRTQENPVRSGGIDYAQMIRTKGGKLTPDKAAIAHIAQANPGSLWLVGNEPDVKWQDNVEAGAYAILYHEAYTAIKTADPTAQVAIGGVTQPSPLRLRYLETVLAVYQETFGEKMPIDVWNVHNFILREERDSWGVDIPPGMTENEGVLYEVEDSDNMALFRQQIVDFRRWMAAQGYRDRALIVTEYGILMPEDYGFPPQRVTEFLWSSFDFFLTATDPEIGYPGDGYRLVQRWCWYSLDAPEHIYPTGRLFDPDTKQMTAVGEGWRNYVETHTLP